MKTGRSAARPCANATARAPTRSGGASATPSHARCVTAAIWSAGGWRRACGKHCRCRSPCASFSAPTDTRRWRARPPTSAPAPTPSWRRSRPTRSGCRSTASASNSATRACRSLRSKADRGSRLRWRTKSSRPPRRSAASCCAWQSRCRIRRSPMPPPTSSRSSTASLSASTTVRARCPLRMRCATAAWSASSRKRRRPPPRTPLVLTTCTRRSLPKLRSTSSSASSASPASSAPSPPDAS